MHDCGHAHPGKSLTSMTCVCFSILRDDLDNSSWHSLVNYHWSMMTETSYQHQLSFMYIILHVERIGNKEQQLHVYIIHCPIFVFRLNSCCRCFCWCCCCCWSCCWVIFSFINTVLCFSFLLNTVFVALLITLDSLDFYVSRSMDRSIVDSVNLDFPSLDRAFSRGYNFQWYRYSYSLS